MIVDNGDKPEVFEGEELLLATEMEDQGQPMFLVVYMGAAFILAVFLLGMVIGKFVL